MKYLFLLLCLFTHSLFAQTDSSGVTTQVNKNSNSNKMQNQMIAELQDILEAQNWRIDTVTNIADVNTANIELISDNLHIKILNAHDKAHNAHAKIDEIDYIVAQNKMFWVVGSLLFFILLGVFYFLLRKKLLSIKQYSKSRRIKIETDLKKEAVRLEQQLVNTNKDISTSNSKLELTSSELERVNSDLADTKTELAVTKKALEAVTAQMEALGNKFESLQLK